MSIQNLGSGPFQQDLIGNPPGQNLKTPEWVDSRVRGFLDVDLQATGPFGADSGGA